MSDNFPFFFSSPTSIEERILKGRTILVARPTYNKNKVLPFIVAKSIERMPHGIFPL